MEKILTRDEILSRAFALRQQVKSLDGEYRQKNGILEYETFQDSPPSIFQYSARKAWRVKRNAWRAEQFKRLEALSNWYHDSRRLLVAALNDLQTKCPHDFTAWSEEDIPSWDGAGSIVLEVRHCTVCAHEECAA